jgi:hypothetical protein
MRHQSLPGESFQASNHWQHGGKICRRRRVSIFL